MTSLFPSESVDDRRERRRGAGGGRRKEVIVGRSREGQEAHEVISLPDHTRKFDCVSVNPTTPKVWATAPWWAVEVLRVGPPSLNKAKQRDLNNEAF